MNKQKMVSDLYNITDHEIEKLASMGQPYWKSVRDFWWSMRENDASTLSPRQAAWLSKIEESLDLEWRPLWNQNEGPDPEYFH